MDSFCKLPFLLVFFFSIFFLLWWCTYWEWILSYCIWNRIKRLDLITEFIQFSLYNLILSVNLMPCPRWSCKSFGVDSLLNFIHQQYRPKIDTLSSICFKELWMKPPPTVFYIVEFLFLFVQIGVETRPEDKQWFYCNSNFMLWIHNDFSNTPGTL